MTRTSKYELSGESLAEFTGGRLISGAGLYVGSGASINSRTITTGQVFFAIIGPRFDGHDFVEAAIEAGAAGIVVAESSLSHPSVEKCVTGGKCFVVAVKDTTEALINAARSWVAILAPRVCAITGSVGKTTTKDLISAAVSSTLATHSTAGNFNNRLGLALTCLGLRPSHEVLVVEMGMNAAGEIAELCTIARPDVGVVTTVAPVHLEGLGTIQNVAAAKAELVQALRSDGVAVLNADDPLVAAMVGKTSASVVWFGRSANADVRLADASIDHEGHTVATFEIKGREHHVALKLAGIHNALNAACAVAAAMAVGVDPAMACAAISSVEPGRHRLALADIGTVRVIDDCYNASPRSVEVALDTLKAVSAQRRRVAILGDMLEMGTATESVHRDAGISVALHEVNCLIAVGRNSTVMASAAVEAGMSNYDVYEAPDAIAAASLAREMLRSRDVVLVKGSRGVGLELVVEAIRARFGTGEAEANN
jgi:UDP-N-acetylmuramoyl-tripeptide--D-alanyl-D-alanine ligase